MSEDNARQFENLLEYLKQSRGFDFTSYKRASLMRRIEKRMQMVEIPGYEEYGDYLEVHPEEFSYLFNTILINVTGFFRDSHVWEYLREDVLPGIVAGKNRDENIRIWVAGCASGEEAYSLAMLLAEVMGPESFVRKVKIYATDLDEEALNIARQASYPARLMAGVPQEMLEKYFDQIGHRYLFNKDLRRAIIFGRHDLIQDAPISRIDLITCRNTLMYFNAEAQAKVLSRFHFALNATGYLLLGKAEMLFAHSDLFVPTDVKRRLFLKTSSETSRDRLSIMMHSAREELVAPAINNNVVMYAQIREAAFNTDPMAQIIINADGIVMFVNDRARTMFGIHERDLGRPFHDLEISYRPVELRSCIEQVRQDHTSFTMKDVEWKRGISETSYLDVQIVALQEGERLLGLKITFADVSRYRQLQEELRTSKQELETAYEELQSSNEELVTTNEELQSTIEELETTNEELQSTNEELETMNEELQSTNEELETMNEELRQQGAEFNEVSNFLQSILASVPSGVVVLDRGLQIQAWNPKCEDLWGVRSHEVVGTHLFNLDTGLPVEQLKSPIRSCLAGERKAAELILPATNRRGKLIQCKIVCTPLVAPRDEVKGVMLLMEEQEGVA